MTGSRDTDQPLIGFDMGGTSTDVSRFADGKYEHVVESTTAGITIQAPQLDINTVAAGKFNTLLCFTSSSLSDFFWLQAVDQCSFFDLVYLSLDLNLLLVRKYSMDLQ